MPPYQTVPGTYEPGSYSIYPQSKVYLVGYAAKPGVPNLNTDQPEAIASAYKSIAGVIAPSLFAPSNQRSITWRTTIDGAPSAISCVLQGSIDDVDANYITVDTSTNTAGETRVVNPNVTPYGPALRFFRIHFVTVTGGTAPSAIVVIQAQ